MRAFSARIFARWFVWLPLLVVGVTAAYFLRPAEQAAPAYSTVEVGRGNLVATVSATGTLSPLITVLVGSQVSGTIESLSADFNQPVKTGEVVAQIEPSLFKANVAEAQAKFKSAEASRDKAAVAVNEARRNLKRVASLESRKLVSDSDVDAARFALEADQAEYRLQVAAVAEAQAALDHERFNLEHTTIRAPIDGVVISRNVDVGQTVAASLQAPTLFTIAQDLTRMQIETDVDEAFIGMVKQGDPVTFTVFAYPRRTFNGTLGQVRLEPKIEAGVVKYNCIVHVDNSDLSLKPGMTATVAIEVERRDDVLKVPNAALRFVPPIPAADIASLRKEIKPGEAVLWTPGANGLEPRRVKTGLVGEKQTQVQGEDVTPGMPVAVPLRKQDEPRKRRGFSLF
ncbi:MAG: efflux RND transporter periplasmic adaptor subunit [Thiogranum sp.]|jgi:HlyD family secretion protein|nr:efflux RND transporter periplasmic adaptor subunit [Thiogranum sp.]